MSSSPHWRDLAAAVQMLLAHHPNMQSRITTAHRLWMSCSGPLTYPRSTSPCVTAARLAHAEVATTSLTIPNLRMRNTHGTVAGAAPPPPLRTVLHVQHAISASRGQAASTLWTSSWPRPKASNPEYRCLHSSLFFQKISLASLFARKLPGLWSYGEIAVLSCPVYVYTHNAVMVEIKVIPEILILAAS